MITHYSAAGLIQKPAVDVAFLCLMNAIQEMYTYAYDKGEEKELSLKITINGVTVLTITYTKHTPIISLRDISLAEQDNWCLMVCLSPSSDSDLFRAVDKRLATPKSVFILRIRRSAHVIKDGADLFVGIVHVVCL